MKRTLLMLMMSLVGCMSAMAQSITFKKVNNPSELRENARCIFVGHWGTEHAIMCANKTEGGYRNAKLVNLGSDGKITLGRDQFWTYYYDLSNLPDKPVLFQISKSKDYENREYFQFKYYRKSADDNTTTLKGWTGEDNDYGYEKPNNIWLPLSGDSSNPYHDNWYITNSHDDIIDKNYTTKPNGVEGWLYYVRTYVKPKYGNYCFAEPQFMRFAYDNENGYYFASGFFEKLLNNSKVAVSHVEIWQEESCSHYSADLEHVEGKKASCETAGVAPTWYCRACGKYFSDAACTKSTTVFGDYIPCLGHNYVDGVCSRCEAEDKMECYRDITQWTSPNAYYADDSKNIFAGKDADGNVYVMGRELNEYGFKAIPLQEYRGGLAVKAGQVMSTKFKAYDRDYKQYYIECGDGNYIGFFGDKICYVPQDFSYPWIDYNYGQNYYEFFTFCERWKVSKYDYNGFVIPSYSNSYYTNFTKTHYFGFYEKNGVYYFGAEPAEDTFDDSHRVFIYNRSCSHEHVTHHDYVAATCEKAGSIEYVSCDECGSTFCDDVNWEAIYQDTSILPTGHTYGADRKCVNCGKTAPFYRKVTNPDYIAEGHNYILVSHGSDGKDYAMGLEAYLKDQINGGNGKEDEKGDGKEDEKKEELSSAELHGTADAIPVTISQEGLIDGAIPGIVDLTFKKAPLYNEMNDLHEPMYLIFNKLYGELITDKGLQYNALDNMVKYEDQISDFTSYFLHAVYLYNNGCGFTKFGNGVTPVNNNVMIYSKTWNSPDHSIGMVWHDKAGEYRFNTYYDCNWATEPVEFGVDLYYATDEDFVTYDNSYCSAIYIGGDDVTVDVAYVENVMNNTIKAEEQGAVGGLDLTTASIDQSSITPLSLLSILSADAYSQSAVAYLPLGAPESYKGKNIIIDGECQSLSLVDGQSIDIRHDFTAASADFAITLGSSWRTLCIPFDVNTLPEGVSVQRLASTVVDDNSDATLTFEPTDRIVAGEPVIIRSTGSTSQEFHLQATNAFVARKVYNTNTFEQASDESGKDEKYDEYEKKAARRSATADKDSDEGTESKDEKDPYGKDEGSASDEILSFTGTYNKIPAKYASSYNNYVYDASSRNFDRVNYDSKASIMPFQAYLHTNDYTYIQSITLVIEGASAAGMAGDIDGDSRISVSDLTLLIKILNGGENTYDDSDADLYPGRAISLDDILRLTNKMLNIEEPEEGDKEGDDKKDDYKK